MVVLMAVGTLQADYDVQYTVEVKDECIKFEDAMYLEEIIPDPYEEIWIDAGLGEEGVVEMDIFVVILDGPCDEASVVVKAGGGKYGKSNETVVVDDAPIQMGAFLVGIFDLGDNTYEITVTSDDDNRTAALSYIELCFCEPVIDPEEGLYDVTRVSPNDAPGVEPSDPD